MTNQRGLRNQYIEGLEDIVKLLRGCREPTILHTDQGSVYASIAYNELIKDTNIVRSMSRAGKPTDNPVNELLRSKTKNAQQKSRKTPNGNAEKRPTKLAKSV